MANRDLPQLDDLEVLTRSHNKVTYASFGTFNFDSAWQALKKTGATSCNLVPNAENDCLEVDVFFGDGVSDEDEAESSKGKKAPAAQQAKQEWEFAPWQYFVALSCLVGATAVAAQGVLI